MACSAIYFLDNKGKVCYDWSRVIILASDWSIIGLNSLPALYWLMFQVLLNRNYRGDIDNSVIDSFISLVNEVEDESLARPLIKTNDCTFAYIKVSFQAYSIRIIIVRNQIVHLYYLTYKKMRFGEFLSSLTIKGCVRLSVRP